MTLQQAQQMDQIVCWSACILGLAIIGLIYIYEKHSRQKKQ
jgi:hypothetical protein